MGSISHAEEVETFICVSLSTQPQCGTMKRSVQGNVGVVSRRRHQSSADYSIKIWALVAYTEYTCRHQCGSSYVNDEMRILHKNSCGITAASIVESVASMVESHWLAWWNQSSYMVESQQLACLHVALVVMYSHPIQGRDFLHWPELPERCLESQGGQCNINHNTHWVWYVKLTLWCGKTDPLLL